MSLPSARACLGDPTKNMLNSRSYITVYNMCLVSMNGESLRASHQSPHWHTCHGFWTVAWCEYSCLDQRMTMSWFHGTELALLSDFVLRFFNVYIRTLGTNRACGSFTMQGICGWPIHSASWLSLNIICQTQYVVVGIKWQCTLYLIFRAFLCAPTP